MKKKRLILVLHSLIEEDKGDYLYTIMDRELNTIVVRLPVKTLLECLGYSTFLNKQVEEIFSNIIILDCEVVINDTKR